MWGNGASVARQRASTARQGVRKQLYYKHLRIVLKTRKFRAKIFFLIAKRFSRFFRPCFSSVFFAFRSFFRNFATKVAKLLRLGKKRIKSFVLPSTFRNFATESRSYCHLEEKTNAFVLFFSRFFVTLPSATAKFLDKPSEQSPDSPSRKKKQTRLFCSSLDFS